MRQIFRSAKFVVQSAPKHSLTRSFTSSYQHQNQKNSYNFNFLFRPAAAVLAGSVLYFLSFQNSSNASTIQQPAHADTMTKREEIIANYQDRIRLLSTPEKIYTYFSSVKRQGEVLMTPSDFVRSLHPPSRGDHANPVQPTNKREFDATRDAVGIPPFFKQLDIHGDGLIDYPSYVFLLMALSLPRREFEVAFKMMDVDRSGFIDAAEFSLVIAKLCGKTPSLTKQRALQPGSLLETERGLVDHLFGKDRRKSLTFAQFEDFLQKIQEEIIRLEFEYYDQDKKGYLTLPEFGEFLANHAFSVTDSQKYKARAQLLPKDTKVLLPEFKEFYSLLTNVEEIQSTIKLFGDQTFTKQNLRNIAYAIAGVDIAPAILDALYLIFDENNSGALPYDPFVTVLRTLSNRGLEHHRDLGVWRLFHCVKSCVSQ